jgi:hypothetical protein
MRALRHATVELRLIESKKGPQGLDGAGVVKVLEVLRAENNHRMPESLNPLYNEAKASPSKKYDYGAVYAQANRAIAAA